MPVGGWALRYGCIDIADPNRTGQYVRNAQDVAYCINNVNQLAPDPFAFSDLKVECTCPAVGFEVQRDDFCTGVQPPVPTLIAPYTTPALDPAPWYIATHPESAYFYGMIIEKVEQLQDPPTSRTINNRATTFGGGTFGSLRKGARVMKFTVLAFGNSECALDYGFRWLSDVFTYQCSECNLCDAEVRTCCPSFADPNNPTYDEWDTGRWQLRDVGLIEGPKKESPPNEDTQCNVQRWSFTLASESPYAYKCPDCCLPPSIWVPALPPCPVSDWLPCAPKPKICCWKEATDVMGDDGIIVEIAVREDLTNVKITVTPDTFGYACGVNTPPANYQSPDACAEINIPFLPEGVTFRYDTSNQKITLTYPGGETRDGTPWVDASHGTPPTFPTLRCGAFCICLESDRPCAFNAGLSTVTILTVHRELAL